MKRKITLLTIGFALVFVGFAVGCFVQHGRTGYHYEVRDTKDYDTSVGLIRWSYVTESVGIPFLDPGTTVLEFDGRTVYKARRGFQESSPYVRSISPTQGGIAWTDGDFRFDLNIQRVKTGELGGAGQPATRSEAE